MGRPGILAGWTGAVCALALSAALGCGDGSSPAPPPVGPPTPAERGTPVGTGARKIVGTAGGFVTSSDGILTVSVPAGALSSDVDLTIDVITNTAPSAVGNAYRIAIAPAGTVLAAPIALVFTPGSSAPLADLSVAWQDATGFWVRQQSVTRDATAGTVTVTTTTLGDWAVVGLPSGRDLIGIFHVESTTGSVPVTANGKSAINFHAGDLTTGWYIQSGQITAASPITAGARTCTPNAPTMSLAPNVAEVLANPSRFRWGVDGHWDLTCSPPDADFAYLSFDTTGIGYLGCTRTHLETPLISPEKLLGRYQIDCGASGTITANWQFEFCDLGRVCPSTNPCHTASITCDTGLPLCVDDGNVPNGTSCDLVAGLNEVCGDGVCNVCRIGEACDPIGNVCHVGSYTCDTGFEVCTDTGAFKPNGVSCDVDAAQPEVCGNGTCNVCYAGQSCATNPNPCVAGTTSCTTGFETCVDTTTPIAAGTACDVNPLVDEVCNGSGTCIECWANQACSTNVNECVAGISSCATGAQTCEDTTTNIANGTTCVIDATPTVPAVCFNGNCNACTAGNPCTTNPNECVAGVTSCTTGQEVCVDTTTPIPNGTTCVIDATPTVPSVCNGGVCNACTAALPCSTNPNNCVAGTTSCATGVETCVDTSTSIAPGTTCGVNQVCNGTGTCIACTTGLACSYNQNECVTGVTSCATGGETCENTTTPIPNGTTCDDNGLPNDEVCNNGVCNLCSAGLACATNPNPCVDGTTSCATGTQTCVDTAIAKPNGTTCDVNPLADEVCNAGTCNACTAGLACASNPNKCVAGVTSCTTGTQQCVDTATPIAAGTWCDVNPLADEVCNGSGACVACTAGLLCSYNQNECVTGVTSCATGGETCQNTTTAVPNGTTCDENTSVPEVCLNGTCNACTAGLACTSNPDALCHEGVTSCATGTTVCLDAAAKANGTVCGTNMVCNAGTCSACTAGLACAGNPDPLCHDGVTSCTTGTSVCEDGATKANGTTCGTDLVCSGGTCSSCVAGAACTGNPDPLCNLGITSCSTGTSVCVDGADRANGTSCGENLVCNAGACSSCTAGVACTDNPDPLCHDGLTSCATGTSVCLDAAAKANGTTCGTNMVCNAGACSSCTAGLGCTANADPCLTGITSCTTGTSVCVDNTLAPEPNGTACGTDQVCNGGVCSSCVAGLACATNPDPCLGGITSCATGTSECVDNVAAPEPNGTVCGTNQVCNAGACTSCTAGVACGGNPDPLCHDGVTSCATGTSVCVDGTAMANGTICGTNLVCNGGACSSCTAGGSCATNPNPCVEGTYSCATGTQVCVDTATPKANGTSCGTNLVCSAGACTSCTAGLACATNPDPCLTGITSCSTGTSVCLDNAAAPEPNGTVCGTDQVCNGGACTACIAGLDCQNTGSCRAGTTSCSTGTSVCVEGMTLLPPGTECGAGQVCDEFGVCAACTTLLDCATNPNPCVAGVTDCTTGSQQCVNTAQNLSDGTTCGTNMVCSAGTCTSCTAGLACATNPDPCLTGVTSCSTGTSVCVDNTLAPEPNGTACGTNQVCSGGACTSCTAGLSCVTNPDPLCHDGVTSCTTGTSVCVDGAAKPAGTTCGTNQVCSAAGTCASCTEGLACATNPDPCLTGITSCDTGTSVCADNALVPEPNGTVCGTDQVCSGGVCGTCVGGIACDTNPDPCRTGTTSCATGTSVCVDSTTAEPNGTVCGPNLVCSGGTCTACTAGGACDTNSDPCRTGVFSCATGSQTCENSTTAEPNGTPCGTNLVCDAGACIACTAGLACTGNPDPLCHDGVTSCTTGASVCVDGTAKPPGTSCGMNVVCSTSATCISCASGLACDTNANPCLTGITSCTTGTQTCVDNAAAPEPNGTVCGTNQVCSDGACTSCTEGIACTTNPNSECTYGVTSCATGTSVCVDGAPKPPGTSCGTNLVCSTAAACVPCTAGLACDTNLDLCLGGRTSCDTGTQTCVDDPTNPEPNGTVCGTSQVCSGGVCSTCVAGVSCTGNPNPCEAGTTSCATGTPVCVNSGTALANGTTCGTNMVCSAGACTSCTAGGTCSTNPDPCLTGIYSCSTGTQTCVDNTSVPEPNGTLCGTNLVCNGGVCTSCVAGGPCDTNTDPCRTGVFSCATGSQTCENSTTSEPNGTVCGTNQVCNGGACTSCTAGTSCTTNPDPCLTGVTSCDTGTSVCVNNTAVPEPNGTSCGTDKVCDAGTCTTCVASVECTPTNSCTVYRTSCATGSSVCTDTGTPVANGTVCGTNQVCNAGVCTACTAGVACSTNPTACLAGTTSCSTGTQTCIDTATQLANGTTCDVNPSVPEVCLNGSCNACTAGVACDTNPDPCRTGTTSCATGTSVCQDSANLEPNGTACGADQVCNGGTCTTCVANAPCQNPGSCYAGTTSCSSGTSVCADGTTPLADGTSCGASSVCASGACVSVRTVSGSRLASYWTTTGTCTAAAPCKSDIVPDDVLGGTARVSARPAAGGTWAEILGTFSANGSFSIPNVPTGPYRLVLVDGRGVTYVVETDASSVDLGYDVLGRSDAQLATSPTLVTFDLTGLTPWFAEDEIEATAFDVDVFDIPVAGADVLSGQTTGGAIEDWGASSAGRALNLLAGTDVLNLHQLSTETATDGVNAFAYQRATVTAAHVGQPMTLAAALAPMTDSGTVTVSWDPEAFEALLAGLGPSATPFPNPHRILVEAAPYASLPAAPIAAYGTPQLFRMVRPGGGPEVALAPISLAPITYGRFLDVQLASDWRRAEFAAVVSYQVGTATPLAVLATVGRRDPMNPAPPTPIVPAVGPVQGPRVAAQDALGTITAPGLTPTLSWSAPAIGVPTHYEVRIHELSADVNGATVSRLLATFRLAGTSTSLSLPTGLLATGKTYFAEIIPYAIASDGFDVAPLRRTNVYSHATTLTSPFTP